MQYATCAANGGELIHASKANHDSFRTLITRCPCCKEPVIWRQEHTRFLSNGKLVNITSAFLHRKSIDPLIIQKCELRVKKLTEQDIKKYAAEARHQRWLILHKHFWNMLLTSKAFNHPEIYELAKRLKKEAVPDKKFYQLLDLSYEEFIQVFRTSELRHKILWIAHDQVYVQMQNLYNQQNYIPSLVEEVASISENLKDIDFESEEFKYEYQEYFIRWDKNYYVATCKEILNFLCSNQSKDLFREILYFIMKQLIGQYPYLLDMDNDPDREVSFSFNMKILAMRKLVEILLMVDWRIEFINAFDITQ